MYSCLARAQEKECNCTEGKYRTVSGICSETSDGNAMPLFRFAMGLNKRWGAAGLRRVESSCLPQTWPGFDFGPLLSICGPLSLLFVLPLPRGTVFLRVSGFPPSTKTVDKKTASPNLNSTRVEDLHKNQLRLM